MPDIVEDSLLVLDGCEASAPDLRTMKAYPEFRAYFDLLIGGNADRILDAAAENAARGGYGRTTAAPNGHGSGRRRPSITRT